MDGYPRTLGPVHLISLAATLPLLLGVLFADLAYSRTYEVQWSNFAAWLLVGAQVALSAGLLLAVFDFFRGRRAGRSGGIYLLVVAVTWLLALINNFVHAMDAWQKMPQALILSAISALAIVVALWFAFGGNNRRASL